MSHLKNIRKEYLLDELSKFVSLKSGIIQTTNFYECSQEKLSCPMASSSGVKNSSKGSGIDLDVSSAMVKSLAEALERYVLRFGTADKATILHDKSAEELKPMGLDFFYPDHDIYEDFVYKNNPRLQKITSKTKTNWVPAVRFSDKKRIWLPEDLIYRSQPKATTLKILSSNGMSCSFLDSAVEDSILELVERDTFLYMWLSKNTGEEILFDEIHYKPLADLIERIDSKKKQIKIAFQYTDTQLPYVFIVFKGQKKYNEPAFFITGSADTYIERACYRSILGFIKLYNQLSDYSLFYKDFERKIRYSKKFTINNFIDRTGYYTLYENFRKCEFLFNMKGQKKLSRLYRKWNTDEKDKALKNFLKAKKVFTANVTPKEVEKTDIRIVRSYSPDLLDLDISEATPFNFSFKKKRVEKINRLFNRKIKPVNTDPHCYT